MHIAIAMHMGRIIISLRLKVMVCSPYGQFSLMCCIIALRERLVKRFFVIDSAAQTRGTVLLCSAGANE